MADVSSRINDRRIIDGPQDDLMQINPVKHKWTETMWDRMLANTWFPSEVDLSNDVQQFHSLLPSEKRMYKKSLAFLTNLDGFQLNNLVSNIGNYITSPEVSMCIVRQSYEEALHVKSYAKMIEEMPVDEDLTYRLFETDDVLVSKNEYVKEQSRLLGSNYSRRNFALAVVANVALEGIYFFNGFLSFFTLARLGKMKESSKMVQFILRDELTHLDLFINIWSTLKEEYPEIFTDGLYEDARDFLHSSAELEATWGKHLIRDGVLGLTNDIIESYTQYLADLRAQQLNLKPIFNQIKNPIPWVADYADITRQEQNFFESKVSAYEKGELIW